MKTVTVAATVVLLLALTGLQAQTTPVPANGRTNFLLTGYSATTFEKEEGSNSLFETSFNPIFLWKPTEQFLFESEVEFEIEEEGTDIGMEFGQIWYIPSDYIMFGFGKFLSPNNMFMERLHPAWINKLPDMPMGLSDHGPVPLLASSQIGAQVRGAFPVGASRIGYAFYVSHGPTLVAEEDTLAEGTGALNKAGVPHVAQEGEEEEEGVPVGFLDFSNVPENNSDKAIGGRVSFLPVPQLEIGYSFETANVGTPGTEFSDIRSLNNVVDFTYVNDIDPLKGHLDIRGQWVWLHIDRADEPPLNYDNTSNGGFAQIAYMPSKVDNPFFKNLEFVFRFDRLDLPDEAEFNPELTRYSFGLNYWFTPSSVLKLAFEAKKEDFPNEPEVGESEETESKFVAQFSLGF
ncbi:MAG: hypothetical protein D6715_04970 [Calditrichaeota bacterium]|nr:MAG: hypothetical protein D6715_04970 [Calditrichota bacterium]